MYLFPNDYNIEKKRIAIITAPSWAWKTTIQNELVARGWKSPANFTTRKPRSDDELDSYVFITEEQFVAKVKNDDFIEFTNYNWNWYWISKHLDESSNVCLVLDPIWRSSALEKIYRLDLPFETNTYFLDISPQVQEERLRKRWDDENSIEERKRDFKWFSPTNNCIVVSWEQDTKIIADIIEGSV